VCVRDRDREKEKERESEREYLLVGLTTGGEP